MAGEILRADIGIFQGQTFFQIVPPSNQPGMSYVLPPGALRWFNADNAARTFVLEERKGDLRSEFYNEELRVGEPFVWPFELVIPSDFDGIWGKITASPTTQPTWKYHGRLEPDDPIARIF